ncbi:MAG: hypothetical protein KDI90_00250 [Alphaproteobacteria bacterium]|nr:hypothetical protein [Alphaproteobacteria bacterium]MCB9974680.1 hypothetical protein [Rhodospirillales bacterium]
MSLPSETFGKIDVAIDIPKSNLKHVAPMRGRFDHHRVSELLLDIYGEEKYKEMQEKGVDQRMMFGTNPHYQCLAMGNELKDPEGNILVPKMPPSKAVAALILPRLEETLSMDGAKDPSNQMRYTAKNNSLAGKLLHKYDEIVLGYASPTCSAHCRYCYRLDLFNKDTGKTSISPEELRDYVWNYNKWIRETKGVDPQTGERRYPVREILLSGGDPLVLPNITIYKYAVAAAQAGVNTLRIGSKELAFRPERVDEAFIETLRILHREYPNLHINLVSHYTHPDEFLERDSEGNYIVNEDGIGYKWMEASLKPVEMLLQLGFVSIHTQTPIIWHVNDDAEAIRILHEEMRRMNISPKYLFQGRDIEGHKAFSLPVESAWKIHNDAMKGIADGGRSRFVMSTEWGKMEVVSVIKGLDLTENGLDLLPEKMRATLISLLGEGITIFKCYRSPHDAESQGDIIIAKGNPEALWLSGYEDRIIYDARRDTGEKFSGLINVVLETFGTDLFDRIMKGRGAANDPALMGNKKTAAKA